MADLFSDLSDNTLQECFLAFPVPSEEANFSGLNDMRDIIAPLQKQIAVTSIRSAAAISRIFGLLIRTLTTGLYDFGLWEELRTRAVR